MAKIPKAIMDELEEQEKLIQERRKNLKTGPNIIRLSYLGQHISQEELVKLESDIKKLGLELSSMDKSGIVYNSISSVAADIALILTEPSVTSIILSGTLTNSLYDGLKALIVRLWSLSKRKPTISITSNTVREHDTKFHLLIKVDEHIQLELKTENLDEKQLSIAIDKICETALKIAENGHNLMVFEPLEKKWKLIKVDIDYLRQPENLLRELPLEKYLEELRNKSTR